MAKLVEKIYGDALFEMSKESGKTDELFLEARTLLVILDENEEIMKLLNHPKLTREEKEKIAKDVFEGRLSEDLLNLFYLLIKKERQKFLVKILKYYIDLVKEYKNIGSAFVTTAIELDESQKKSIESKLISTTKYESFEISYSVDSSLIGGMVIRVGDKVIDSSLRNKIDKLSRDLYKIRLERW